MGSQILVSEGRNWAYEVLGRISASGVDFELAVPLLWILFARLMWNIWSESGPLWQTTKLVFLEVSSFLSFVVSRNTLPREINKLNKSHATMTSLWKFLSECASSPCLFFIWEALTVRSTQEKRHIKVTRVGIQLRFPTWLNFPFSVEYFLQKGGRWFNCIFIVVIPFLCCISDPACLGRSTDIGRHSSDISGNDESFWSESSYHSQSFSCFILKS